jgi:hypothetical protein
MKLDGKKIEGPNEEIIIIPRSGEDGNIVFKARALLNLDDFDRLCPRPTPRKVRNRDGSIREDRDNADFKVKLETYANRHFAYMVIKSLEATENLEWEEVDINNPTTWTKYEEELKESGFSQIEINRIITGVMTANCLNEAKLEEARNSFLAGQRELANQKLSLSIEQDDTQSGERASA